jgi:hypothetical protein
MATKNQKKRSAKKVLYQKRLPKKSSSDATHQEKDKLRKQRSRSTLKKVNLENVSQQVTLLHF